MDALAQQNVREKASGAMRKKNVGLTLPSPAAVANYLATNRLAEVLDAAANDAVKKLVSDPCAHVAMLLLEESALRGGPLKVAHVRELEAVLEAGDAQQKLEELRAKEATMAEADSQMANMRIENDALREMVTQLQERNDALRSEASNNQARYEVAEAAVAEGVPARAQVTDLQTRLNQALAKVDALETQLSMTRADAEIAAADALEATTAAAAAEMQRAAEAAQHDVQNKKAVLAASGERPRRRSSVSFAQNVSAAPPPQSFADIRRDTLKLVFAFLDADGKGEAPLAAITAFGGTLYRAALSMQPPAHQAQEKDSGDTSEPEATRAFVRVLLSMAVARPYPYYEHDFLAFNPPHGCYTSRTQEEVALRMLRTILEDEDGREGMQQMVQADGTTLDGLRELLCDTQRRRVFDFLDHGKGGEVHRHWLAALSRVVQRGAEATPDEDKTEESAAVLAIVRVFTSMADDHHSYTLPRFLNYVPPAGSYVDTKQEKRGLDALIQILDTREAAMGMRKAMVNLVADGAMKLLFRFLDDRGRGTVDQRKVTAFARTLKRASARTGEPEESAAVEAFCSVLDRMASQRPTYTLEQFVKFEKPKESLYKSIEQEETAVHVCMTILGNRTAMEGLREAVEKEMR